MVMIFLPGNAKIFCQRFDETKKTITFATSINAQMAELVDALVSNTNGFISMPVRSRLWALLKMGPLVDNQSIRVLFL